MNRPEWKKLKLLCFPCQTVKLRPTGLIISESGWGRGRGGGEWSGGGEKKKEIETSLYSKVWGYFLIRVEPIWQLDKPLSFTYKCQRSKARGQEGRYFFQASYSIHSHFLFLTNPLSRPSQVKVIFFFVEILSLFSFLAISQALDSPTKTVIFSKI